ncbi:MAG: hypothetical protein LC802_22960 [Acidobacteria bacterium]|nr:hypothetical protein [Acidobacteriota bacterium]
MIWSFSNSHLFKKCQRQWYFKTHVANANAKKIPLQREAYLLSKLQSIAAWRGSIVDHVISRRVVPALGNGWNISLAKTLEYARTVFDAQLDFALRHRVREPGMSVAKCGDTFAAFHSVEYGPEVGDDEIARAWADVELALTNLLHSFGLHDYRLQLATYAVALARCEPHKDFPPALSLYAPADIRLLEVQLLTDQRREYTLSDSDIEGIDSYIAETSTVMVLADGEGGKGAPRPFDYPVTQYPDTCQRCPFRKPCWESEVWQESKQISFR